MKKLLTTVSLLLASVTVLSVPASAIAIITGDSFTSDEKSKEWVTDRYAPEEFDVSDGKLYLALGKSGYYRYRPADKKSKYYAQQGKKLKLEKPSSTTWTAVVKLDIDDSWFSSSSNRKRAEFRIDLVDGKGKPIKESPALALVKGGSSASYFKFFNPEAKTDWGLGDKFINGDDEVEDFYVEDGEHSLFIKSSNGVISYYVDEKKLGNCTLDTQDVYPSYVSLSAYNYERPDVICWDNFYLYDGSYGMRALSSKAQDRKDDRLEEKYEKKRDRWKKRYTQYYFEETRKWYKESKIPSDLDIGDADDKRLTKDMPDSYWDY